MEAISVLAALIPSIKIADLTLAQWGTIASALYSAEPAIKALLTDLHPAFAAIAVDLASGSTPEQAASAAQQRAPTFPFNPSTPR
jgi:hypothetical protein